jgi:hypothetical protein
VNLVVMEIYPTEIDIGVQNPYHAIVHMHDYIDIATNLKSRDWRVRLDEKGDMLESTKKAIYYPIPVRNGEWV